MVKNLSVFLPVYNEEKNLEKTVVQTAAFLRPNFSEWEIIIVNDGSSDKTSQVAQRLALAEPRIKIITHVENRGYGAAFKSGIHAAKYDWVTFTDADGQFDFAEISKFLKIQEESGADLVIGYYLNRRVPFYRKLNTFFWEGLVRILFGLRVRDIDCAFKLFSNRVVVAVEPLESERGAFISTEFLVKAKKKGFKIREVGVSHFPRQQGHGTGANLDVIVKSFVDLFRLWKKLR